jgi:hypothetical protein
LRRKTRSVQEPRASPAPSFLTVQVTSMNDPSGAVAGASMLVTISLVPVSG